MTMLDEGTLQSLLAAAADGLAVPDGGADRIAASARELPEARSRSLIPHGRGGRLALTAAAVAIVVGVVAATGGTTGTPTGRHAVAGPAAGSGPAVGSGPTGSGQAGYGQAGLTPAGAGAPSSVAPSANAAAGKGAISSSPSSPSSLPASPSTPSLPTGIVGQPARVVTTGAIDLALGSDPLNQAVARLTTLATGVGGYVASSNVQVGTPGDVVPSSGTVVLQIPQGQFAAVVDQVRTIAKVTSMSSSSTDVTGQYVDLQARIDALQASRQQYLTILSRATSIGDILSVQSQLDTIQSQIEQLQGQLDLLGSQTTYATLTVSMSQSGHRHPPPPAPPSGMSQAWHQSVHGFTSGFEWLVRIAGRTLFVLGCLVVLALAARGLWRYSRRRML